MNPQEEIIFRNFPQERSFPPCKAFDVEIFLTQIWVRVQKGLVSIVTGGRSVQMEESYQANQIKFNQ